ncbi:unnamed protein product [Trichogramma brassicae]|uniref:Uncharacterized protein n=1 Tax=Trichogramma brassicae TaxID=86971 RepID=A0A6H5HSX3_9HYME|nr:unnamed protein product [Trichogramma brassicae]
MALEQQCLDGHEGLQKRQRPVAAAVGLELAQIRALDVAMSRIVLAGVRADRQAAAPIAREQGAAGFLAGHAHGRVLVVASRPLHHRRVLVDELVAGYVSAGYDTSAACKTLRFELSSCGPRRLRTCGLLISCTPRRSLQAVREFGRARARADRPRDPGHGRHDDSAAPGLQEQSVHVWHLRGRPQQVCQKNYND